MNEQTRTTFDEVIDEIMLEEPDPSHEALTRWCERYPEHKTALTNYFATWALQEVLPAKPEKIDEARAGQRMVSQALNLLHRHRVAKTGLAEADKAVRLLDAVKSSSLSEEDIAARCRLDESLLVKLDRRLLEFTSIPRMCFERLASALGRGMEQVRAMFEGCPIAAGANKAHGKPAIKTEDFLDAVRSSDLPEQVQAEWAAIVERECGHGEAK
jgi:hypothetical protein